MAKQADKVQVGFVDLTPSWKAIAPILIEAFRNGTAEAQAIACSEIERMAELADRFVSVQHAAKDLVPALNNLLGTQGVKL